MTVPSSTSSSDRRPLLAALALAVGLLGVDRLARFEAPFSEHGEDMQPFAHAVYAIDPSIAPGLSPRARFFRNAQGLRGRVLSGRPEDVLLVGGSTAACTLLDERDALHMAIEEAAGSRVRVAVLGRGGYPLERLVPLLDQVLATRDLRPGKLVLMLGANEVEQLINHLPWTAGAQWDPSGPYGPESWSHTFAGWYRPNADGRFLLRPRHAYATATKSDHLAPGQQEVVGAAIGAFGRTLRALVRRATAAGVRVVLVTQPVAFDAEAGHAHPGWAPFFHAEPGSGVVPSPQLMHVLVEGFNDAARAVATAENLALVDLSRSLPACAECFYDQWHFTIRGSRRAAAEIAAAMNDVPYDRGAG